MENKEIKLTKDNFNAEVSDCDKPVLVDFWATWCGPCKMLAPVLSEVAEDFSDTLKVGKVNVDEEAELAIKYNISSIPALILFKNGEIQKTAIGYQTKEELIEIFGL